MLSLLIVTYDLKLKADIVFCCNVLLHLPDLKSALINLLKSFKKKLIVRTLISEKTHLSQYLTLMILIPMEIQQISISKYLQF